MRATLFTAAAAIVLLSATLSDHAEGMTFFGTPPLRPAATEMTPWREAAVVCSNNGCAQVHTSRVRPHRPRP